MESQAVSKEPRLGPSLDGFFKNWLREIPDFPIQGIRFKDLAPVLAQPGALSDAVSSIAPVVEPLEANTLLAIDARGFVLGAALADRLRCGFVMVRKPGKLPGSVHGFDYTCEYCSGRLEVSQGLIRQSSRCLIVDDLLATGGTARATADFVSSLGAVVAGYAFLVEIQFLMGRGRLTDAPVTTLFKC